MTTFYILALKAPLNTAEKLVVRYILYKVGPCNVSPPSCRRTSVLARNQVGHGFRDESCVAFHLRGTLGRTRSPSLQKLETAEVRESELELELQRRSFRETWDTYTTVSERRDESGPNG